MTESAVIQFGQYCDYERALGRNLLCYILIRTNRKCYGVRDGILTKQINKRANVDPPLRHYRQKAFAAEVQCEGIKCLESFG